MDALQLDNAALQAFNEGAVSQSQYDVLHCTSTLLSSRLTYCTDSRRINKTAFLDP